MASLTSYRFNDDLDRIALANELHARPFPVLTAPCRAIFLAVRPEGGAERDHDQDRRALIALVDRYGGQHPAPDAKHYSGELGRGRLRWESHTEFVTYTLFAPGIADIPFGGDSLSLFPDDWLAEFGGSVVAAAKMRIEVAASAEQAMLDFENRIAPSLAAESVACAIVGDGEALIASDFRIHEDGLARIALHAIAGLGPMRLGRLAQRLLEIEAYKSFALLSLPEARRINARVTTLDRELGALKDADLPPADALTELTRLAAEVERLSTESAFRFGAVNAYEAIVNDRIEVLREQRVGGKQLFSEFMKRRFDPAMRTCRSAERRLQDLSNRVARASTLLSTQVNVAAEAQNRELLESMNKRAEMQLRLQQTVEGLSVVAISYYGVSLAGYLMKPFGKSLGVDGDFLTAAIAIPVVLAVWWTVRRIRRSNDVRD